jgi:uncharacterized phage protein (TIGR01671 family)
MKREIIFRGRLKNMKQWVYGFYLREISASGDILDFIASENDDDWLIDIGTLGQYTGLKDKNGKMIFEGDKVKDVYGTIFEIRFGEYSFVGLPHNGFYGARGDVYIFSLSTQMLSHCEIIGNIHEEEK